MMRWAWAAGACGVLAIAALGVVSPKEIQWDMANEYNDTSIHAEGDKVFAAALLEKTGGAIKITHHFGGAIGFKSKDQLDAVADGALPIANTFVGPLGGIDPMFLLPSLPFLAATPTEARRLYEIAKPRYEAVFAANNQKLLYSSPWPPSGFWAHAPMDSLEALSGLKIRTYDANGTVTLKAAGAAPIQLSWADVAPQLATGGVSGVLTSAESGVNGKFWEHLSHFTEANYAMPLNMVHINLDVWNDLDADQQAAVLAAAKAAEDYTWNEVKQRVASNYQEMRENGIVIVDGLAPEYLAALRAAGDEARAVWIEKTGPDGAAILAEFQRR
ncbi:MAG: TRAP transporter substrate-binding protein [Pseudomonadota bacterium]